MRGRGEQRRGADAGDARACGARPGGVGGRADAAQLRRGAAGRAAHLAGRAWAVPGVGCVRGLCRVPVPERGAGRADAAELVRGGDEALSAAAADPRRRGEEPRPAHAAAVLLGGARGRAARQQRAAAGPAGCHGAADHLLQPACQPAPPQGARAGIRVARGHLQQGPPPQGPLCAPELGPRPAPARRADALPQHVAPPRPRHHRPHAPLHRGRRTAPRRHPRGVPRVPRCLPL